MIRFAAILIVCAMLAGCAGDPLRDVPRLADADVSDADIQAALRGDADVAAEDVAAEDVAEAPDAAPRGLFGRLFGTGTDRAGDETGAETPLDVAETPSGAEDAQIAADAPAAEGTETMAETAAAPRRGLLGFLSRAAQSARAEEPVELAALPGQPGPDAAPTRGGDPDAPDFRIVPLGTVLPYGVLARVCDVPDRQLGTRVDRYPDTRSVYTLYDSQPGNTAPHSFYLTGFDDGCARQFTAALALFGSPETHEQLRYGLPSKVQPYSTTDAAYETLKSRVCGVGKGKPCGSSMSRLARNTAFVSVYETFGSNPEWKTILLHDGEVVETDIRSN